MQTPYPRAVVRWSVEQVGTQRGSSNRHPISRPQPDMRIDLRLLPHLIIVEADEQVA